VASTPSNVSFMDVHDDPTCDPATPDSWTSDAEAAALADALFLCRTALTNLKDRRRDPRPSRAHVSTP
jgi:hypothetical protein